MASPPESQFNSPNVPVSTASELLAGPFSPSQYTALDYQVPLGNQQMCNGDRVVDGKLLSPKCVDPKVFLRNADCSGDEDDPRQHKLAKEDGIRPMDKSSCLPPKLRRPTSQSSLLSHSSSHSMSESGNENDANHFEEGSSYGEPVDQAMAIDPKEQTSDREKGSKDTRSCSRVNEKEVELKISDSMAVDETIPENRGKEKSPSPDSMTVDETLPGNSVEKKRPSLDSNTVDAGHSADRVNPTNGFRVISEDRPMDVDESNEISLDSVLSVLPELTSDLRRSSRLALTKPNSVQPMIEPSQTSWQKKRTTSKKGEDLIQANIPTAKQ